MSPSPRALALALAAVIPAAAACHTASRVRVSRPGPPRSEVDRTRARALPPTIVVTADGRFRFVEPLRCAADVLVDVEAVDEVTVEANLATVVVGVIVAAAGAVAAVRGLADDDGAGWTLLGAGGLVVGLPLAIGPWIGTGAHDEGRAVTTLRRGATEEPCGDRPVAARRAGLRLASGVTAYGAVGADGAFAVSPFAFVDVFAVGEQPALDVTADLIGDGPPQTIEAVIDAAALAAARDGYLAAAGIDARVEPLRKVPRLAPGPLAVSRLTIDGIPHLRVALGLRNEGPGDAWRVRGIVSSGHAELDRRVVYVGRIAAGGAADVELLVPVSPAAIEALAGADVELQLELRDAHGTAPERPVTFRGRVLAGAPR